MARKLTLAAERRAAAKKTQAALREAWKRDLPARRLESAVRFRVGLLKAAA